MKLLQQTDRLLQLRQNNWLPWYWQLLMWPTVGLFLLMSLTGSESKLTCQRSKGQCQLDSQSLSGKIQKTIPLAEIQKIDLIASDESDTSSTAQLVLIGQGSKTPVGDSHSYDDMDEVANKLAWYLGNSNAEFIEISESSIWFGRAMGLAAGTICFLFFWRGETRVISFDKDRGVCRIESRRIGRQQATEHQISQIKDVELLDNFKPVGQKMVLRHNSGASSPLTERVLPLTHQVKNAELVRQIRQFLGLKSAEAPVHFNDEEEFSDHGVIGEDIAVYESDEDSRDSDS